MLKSDPQIAQKVQRNQKIPLPETILRGINLLLCSDYKEVAIWALDKLLDDFPQDAYVHNNRAILAYDQGDMSNARQHYERAAILAPKNPRFQKDLGEFYVIQGQKELAIKQIEKVLTITPQDVECILTAAHICVSLRRFDEARQYYQRVVCLDPGRDDIHQYLNGLDSVAPGNIKSANLEELYAENRKETQAGNKDTIELNPQTTKEHMKSDLAFNKNKNDTFRKQVGRDVAVEKFVKALHADPGLENALFDLMDVADPVSDYDTINSCCHDYLQEKPDDTRVMGILNGLKKAHYDDILSRSVLVEARNSQKPYLLSVVVSTYKSEEFMDECLADLESQTIADRMEIIVIDAASPQGERFVVEEYQKRYSNIRYIRTPNRIGIYAAWNLGALVARGELLTPFSTNDRLDVKAYEVLSSYLQDHRDIDFVYGNTHLTDLPHQTMGDYAPCTRISNDFAWPNLTWKQLIWQCGVGPHPMWRKRVHEKIGYFDERYLAIGDQDFFIRIARKSPLGYVNFFTGLQWITSDSLSGKAEAYWEIFQVHFNHQQTFLKDMHRSYTTEEESLLERKFVFTIVKLVENEHVQEAISFYDKFRKRLPALNGLSQMDVKIESLRKSLY